MTPTSIKTGRGFSADSKLVPITGLTTDAVLPADGNRVGVALAIKWAYGAVEGAIIVAVGPIIDGALVPFTLLNPTRPACYLDVAHLGPMIAAPLFYQMLGDEVAELGVTQVRTIRELE